MSQKTFIPVIAGLLLTVFFGAFAASAQEQVLTSENISGAAANIVQAAPAEISPLPVKLTDQQAGAPRLLAFSTSHASNRAVRCLSAEFYKSVQNHPLTGREVEMRDAVNKLGEHRNQFVQVRLKNGKILTGKIVSIFSSDYQSFGLQTGIFSDSYRCITYSELAETPRAVPAVGTRTVHALEWTGIGALCVAAIALAIVLLPLMMMGVLND